MRRSALAFAACLLALSPLSVAASETTDLIFANRAPWAPPAEGFVWQTERTVQGRPQSSQLVLKAMKSAEGADLLSMSETSPAGTRPLTQFPVSAGDPVVIYFLEAATRDMAEMSGGSPFYIRNRIKDAMRTGGKVTHGAGGTSVEVAPFAGDKNAARMAGFDELTLRFDFGADAAKPIRHLRAEAPKAGPDKKGYIMDMTLQAAAP